ncbi:MAG: ATP synthase subunit B family protein [Phycisphaerales bacterium]
MNQAASQIMNMIASIRRRWLLRLAAISLTTLIIGAAAWLLSMIVIDNTAMLGRAGLVGGWGVIITLLIGGIAKLFDHLTRKRPGDTQLAMCYEHAAGDQQDRLVNAVQMLESGRQKHDAMAAAVVVENAAKLNHAAAADAIDLRPVRNHLLAMTAVLLPLVLYVAIRPAWAVNAMQRLFHPLSPGPHLLETDPRSLPGDVTMVEGSPLVIEAVLRDDVTPARYANDVTIEYRLGGTGWSSVSTKLNGNGRFTHRFDAVWQAMSYRVRAGRGVSPVYQVTLRQRPRLTRIALTVTEPDYAGGAVKQLAEQRGDATVLAGSTVRVNITADRALSDAAMVLGDGSQVKMTVGGMERREASGETRVRHDATYTIAITDTSDERLANAKPAQYTLIAAADQTPTALVTVPGRDLVLPLDATLPLKIEAGDDIGLSAVTVEVRRTEGDWTESRRWPVKETRRKSATFEMTLPLAKMKLKEGEVLLYRAVAWDNRPSEMGGAQSGPGHTWSITVGAAAGDQSLVLAQRKQLLEQLKLILKMQRDNRGALDMDQPVPAMRKSQDDIRQKTTAVIDEQNRTVSPPVTVIGELVMLADGPMLKLMRMLDGYDGAYAERAKRKPNVLAMMDVVIERLAKLVGEVEREVARAEGIQAALAKLSPERKEEAMARLRATLEKLRQFNAEQDKVIEETKELVRKGTNLTDKDEQEIERLKGTEDKWSDVFSGGVGDINKLTEQGLADRSIANDYKEMVEQIEAASAKLDQKLVVMAVPREQSGREMATKLAEEMEMWLPAGGDNLKWVMEEPVDKPEIPMVDLPDELSDLIGDLMDEENALNEAAQDVTSSWADSISAAGWAVGDGPISNFSAVGKTGNQLPNKNELSGRAGEGRSGQSQGQLVQDVVRGLGGRTTPTRNTNDPYEQGVVKELQQTATSGATGGGKARGGGQEGLQGDPGSAPPMYGNLQYMKDWQRRIRDKTERVVGQLKQVRIASPELESAVKLMKEAEDDAANGRYQQMFKRQKMVMTTLEAARDLTAHDVSLRVDGARSGDAGRNTVLDAGDEPVPMEYRGAVQRYFEQLSE